MTWSRRFPTSNDALLNFTSAASRGDRGFDPSQDQLSKRTPKT